MAKPLRKAEARLQRRIVAYAESLKTASDRQKKMLHKPGSMQKK